MRTNRLIAMICAVMLLLPAGISVAAEAVKGQVGGEAARTDAGKKEAAKSDAGKTEPAKSDAAKKEAAKSDVEEKEATKGDVAKADAARKKPLQRCDQLNDKAEIECLQKAREGVVEARRQREASGKRDDKYVGKDVPRDTSAKNPAKKATVEK